ncbi:hypothetical protein PHLGIDRAFT_106227 [Phlebiopsis gigantea 11061_1 CR5-6]|uniref:Ribosomal protein L22 n=1 Tax=Phlebiopsis gigantea (strain 11061_1 CR5-6) TaxID=745531 RepID=A0A0C3RY97_PHLG1|nr:hypothetical protein PHLGIDRAFT_106227 [Phlebiopsis gigantea 11061_1 CR5-6]
MQSLGGALRRASVAASSVRSLQPGPSTRLPGWDARRHASWTPLSWIRDQITLKYREQASPEEVAKARKEQVKQGQGSIFESVNEVTHDGTQKALPTEIVISSPKAKKHTEHKYSTANFKMSHRKLNMLGRQISGKPIDSAILQMMFSEKRASNRIKSMLVVAKDHATAKGLEEKKLVVAQAWVSKGPNVLKRIDMKGRGRWGIREHPDSRLSVILKEGKTWAQLKEEEKQRKLKRIVSASLTRENVPLRNPGPAWAW